MGHLSAWRVRPATRSDPLLHAPRIPWSGILAGARSPCSHGRLPLWYVAAHSCAAGNRRSSRPSRSVVSRRRLLRESFPAPSPNAASLPLIAAWTIAVILSLRPRSRALVRHRHDDAGRVVPGLRGHRSVLGISSTPGRPHLWASTAGPHVALRQDGVSSRASPAWLATSACRCSSAPPSRSRARRTVRLRFSDPRASRSWIETMSPGPELRFMNQKLAGRSSSLPAPPPWRRSHPCALRPRRPRPPLQRTPMPIELPKLPFEDSALAPTISSNTIGVPLRQTSQGVRRQPEQGHRGHRPRREVAGRHHP